MQELAMHQRLYKCYGQWTAIDIHKNRWLENQTVEQIGVCIFQDVQTNKIQSFKYFYLISPTNLELK